MNVDKLINDMCDDLKPVKPMRCTATCVVLFGFIVLALIRVAALFIGEVRGSMADMMTTSFMIEIGLLFFAGLCALIAAFKLRVPDTKVRPSIMALLLLPTIIVVGMDIYAYMMSSGVTLIEEVHSHEKFLHEVTDLMIMIAIPTALLFYVISKAAPTFKMWTGYSIVLATACFAAIALRMFCGMDHGAHLLMYHYLPIAGASVLGILAGRFLLRW